MNKTRDRLILTLAIVMLSVLTTPSDVKQSFQGLGGLTGGLFFSTVNAESDDVSAQVGNGESPSDAEAYLWTSGGAWSPGAICSNSSQLVVNLRLQ